MLKHISCSTRRSGSVVVVMADRSAYIWGRAARHVSYGAALAARCGATIAARFRIIIESQYMNDVYADAEPRADVVAEPRADVVKQARYRNGTVVNDHAPPFHTDLPYG